MLSIFAGKVERKYAGLPGQPVLIRMSNIPAGGLGLILSTRREEVARWGKASNSHSQFQGENRPPVIVVGVKSDSPLSLKVGDELLEVNKATSKYLFNIAISLTCQINGRVLFGLSHQEATEKIKQCCQHSGLSLLVLRKTIATTTTTAPQQPAMATTAEEALVSSSEAEEWLARLSFYLFFKFTHLSML
jgi:hypothetical protein